MQMVEIELEKGEQLRVGCCTIVNLGFNYVNLGIHTIMREASLGIDAPPHVTIFRSELIERASNDNTAK